MASGWNFDELVAGFDTEKEEVCNGAGEAISVDERSGESDQNSKIHDIVHTALIAVASKTTKSLSCFCCVWCFSF